MIGGQEVLVCPESGGERAAAVVVVLAAVVVVVVSRRSQEEEKRRRPFPSPRPRRWCGRGGRRASLGSPTVCQECVLCDRYPAGLAGLAPTLPPLTPLATTLRPLTTTLRRLTPPLTLRS